MQRKIVFNEWKDPFENEDNKIEDEDDDEDGEGWKSKKLEKRKIVKSSVVGPIIVSRFGVMPLTDDGVPSRNHKFYVMHTNFRINYAVKEAICGVDGVESFDVFTPYRARISFGRLFDDDDVKDGIRKAVTEEPESEEAKLTKIYHKMLIGKAKQKYPFWSVATFKNGETAVISGKTKEEVEGKIDGRKADITATILSWEENEEVNETSSE